MGFNVVCESIK